MIRLLLLCFLVVPAVAQGQQDNLVAECKDLKGHTYYIANSTQPKEGWDFNDSLTGVRLGLFLNLEATSEADSLYIMYYTSARGWHFPNLYVTTLTLNTGDGGVQVIVPYQGNAAELYTFYLTEGKVAVSLMRHGSILTNARLFVGDCERK